MNQENTVSDVFPADQFIRVFGYPNFYKKEVNCVDFCFRDTDLRKKTLKVRIVFWRFAVIS